jgi:hypothetical protein
MIGMSGMLGTGLGVAADEGVADAAAAELLADLVEHPRGQPGDARRRQALPHRLFYVCGGYAKR